MKEIVTLTQFEGETMEERMRWRNNPAIVAQYYNGDQLPSNIDVHLKPNEACVVIENGTIVSVTKSSRLTVNPDMSLLSKLLSKKEPFRAFLFAHTGPHELLIQLKGTWADGSKAVGMAGLKINLNPDNMGRLLALPAKGKTSITLGDIADLVSLEISNKFNSMHVVSSLQDDVKNNPDNMILMESGLRGIAQSALADLGANLERVWLSWNPNEHDRIMAMRNELELMAEEGRLISEKNRLEMERMLAQEVSVLERQHQLLVATTEYEAKAAAAKDLAALRVKAEREREQWSVITQRDELEAENKRRTTELEARQTDLEGSLEHDNQMRGLDRTMDFEDKEAELEHRRRMRKMKTANEQAEFMRQQEMQATKHNEKMLKGVFDAMDDEDGE